MLHNNESLATSEPDSLVDPASSRTLAKYAVATILIGDVLTLIGLGAAVPETSVRAVAPLMMMVVGLTGWLLLAAGRVRAAVRVIVLGAWVVITGVATFTGGVRAPVIIVYPVIIVTAGWLINARAALILAASSVAVTLALALAESRAYLPAALFSPSAVYAVDQVVVYVLAVLLTVFVLRAFQSRLQQLRRASNEMVQLTFELENSEAQLQRAQSVAKVGSWVWDLVHDSIDLSDETCRIFGLPNGTLGGHDAYLARSHPDDRALVEQAWQTALRGGDLDLVHRILMGNTVRWIHQKAELELATDGTPLRAEGVTQDITEHKQMQEQVRQLAFYDELTKLPNRRLLNERLSQTMLASKRSARYGALLFLDLDNFKPLNDTHGHSAGDLLLLEAAERLRRCVREIDTVARFGGDEFVVMLNELDGDKDESVRQSGVVAEKIRVALAQPYLLSLKSDGQPDALVEHHCSASIGVIVFINHEARQDDILKWADKAMYQAKAAGRNSIRFYDPLNQMDSPAAPSQPGNRLPQVS